MSAIPESATHPDTETGASESQQRQVERFLYREARLLDSRRFDDWLATVHDDIDYLIHNRYTPHTGVRAGGPSVESELQDADGMQLAEDNRSALKFRIRRLNSGQSYSEVPASRTVRFVSNIEVFLDADPNVLRAESCVHCAWSRKETAVEHFYGRRTDRIFAAGAQLLLLGRKIVLNESVLAASSISLIL